MDTDEPSAQAGASREPGASLQLQEPSAMQTGGSRGTRSVGQTRSGSLGGSFGGIAGTPHRSRARRADLGKWATPDRNRSRQPGFSQAEPSQLSGDADSQQRSDTAGDAHNTYIWGTRLVIADMQAKIRRFLREFKREGTSNALYVTLIMQAVEDEDLVVNVDCQDMRKFDVELYSQLVAYPMEVIPLLDAETNDVVVDQFGPETAEQLGPIMVRTFNLAEQKVIRDLNPTDMNRLIAVSGMVTRTSSVIPDIRCGLFKCESCGAEAVAWNVEGIIEEPTVCPDAGCGAKHLMKLLHNRSEFSNKQLIKMQENPNDIPEGETPHAVSMFCFDTMVDVAKPGDRVTVTGVYKAQSMRVNPRLRTLKSIYKTYIDIIHVSRDEQSKLFSVKTDSQSQSQSYLESSQQPHSTVSQEPLFQLGNASREDLEAKEAEMRALGAEPDIYEKLTASLAPSIWQMEDVKKGVLCQLFGGTTKEFEGGRVRGELNVLLVGDPGVSKSQILSYVHKIAQRGMYTSGRGSSAVGLTAYVTKDPETKEMVLESGALVMSDLGVCCIDEFDKMSESARSMLHEVMEQQTVSVAKAGIISTLNARTSVLAAANPVGSRYNPRMSVIDNIQLPPSLLSRFDLIYLVLDKADEATDRKLARHLIGLFYEHEAETPQAVIPMEQLKDYIAYARMRCQPEITESAAEDLVAGYLQMRRNGVSKKTITATPRQLESLVRLSEALARMRLSPTVERGDVAEALRLIKVAMQQAATDPTTGAIDMDAIYTGITASDRRAADQLSSEIKQLLIGSRTGMTVAEITTRMNQQATVAVSETQVRTALERLSDCLATNAQTRKISHTLAQYAE